MNLTDYIKKMAELQNEIENIYLVDEKNQVILNSVKNYEIDEKLLFGGYIGVMYNSLYLDTDLLANALEQQKEKNEARLNEIKQEISKLQKDDIQLWSLNIFS